MPYIYILNLISSTFTLYIINIYMRIKLLLYINDKCMNHVLVQYLYRSTLFHFYNIYYIILVYINKS